MTIPIFKSMATRLSAAVGLAVSPSLVTAEWGLNLPYGVTTFSQNIYDLHMLILWICIIIAAIVFSAIFYSIIVFRKSRGAVAATWHESTTVEIVWTIVPLLILIGMAIPATKSLIMMEDVAAADMTVKVTGYQWKWHYEYIEDDIAFFSTILANSNEARRLNSGIEPTSVDNYLLDVDNYVVVPINKKIRFLTTAGDVIHAWWVPDLGWKRDAVPGFINESWAYIKETGIYRGQCAELCGKDHGFMPIVVKAVTQTEYDAWVAEQKAAQTVSMSPQKAEHNVAVSAALAGSGS